MLSVAGARNVLLLQGPNSPFYSRLARALERRGARVLRVIFAPGDALFWRGRSVAFRGRPQGFRPWLAQLIRREGITDLVCLGDGRDRHREGLAVARAAGVATHVLEQGYLRPGWLTLDPGGTGGASAFQPKLAAAGHGEPHPGSEGAGFVAWAAMDVAATAATLAAPLLGYPHYRRHALVHPLAEWAGWALKAALWPLRRWRRRRGLAWFSRRTGPLFLLPLQLETDFQIRNHGRGKTMRGHLRRTVLSFARQASPECRLAVKVHPLDPFPWRWAGEVSRLARRLRVSERLLFLDGGELGALLGHCSGVVTVNSTVGLTALRAGLPVAVLGDAVWARPDLVARPPLAAFWHAPRAPGPKGVETLMGALTATIQVPGAFDGRGACLGAEGVADRIACRHTRRAAA